jgi:uncharacterized iron-regulated membrane protein
MARNTIKVWLLVHKWTSLICTAFLLLLCLTGLPLIFHHELDHLLDNAVDAPAMPAGTAHADLDRVIDAGKRQRPGEVVQFVVWDRDEPDLVELLMAVSIDAPPENNRLVVVDARTAQVLGEPRTQEGLTYILFKLHTDMFAGLPGLLFLGVMGLLFAAAIVSGVVVSGPFMRRLDFGTVRENRSARTRWLDLHNLLGVVTLTWALVVGATGVINTWAELIFKYWQADQLAAMVAPYRDKPPPSAALTPAQAAINVAREAAPGMAPRFIAMPGTPFSSRHHYAVFMRGDAPLTARLLRPVLVDAETGAVTAVRDLPWYMTTLLVSQPLHFGDYGGMPLKIIWALLDVVTIIVLGSGLYLWLARRRSSIDVRLAEIEEAEALAPPASTSTTAASTASGAR